LNQILQEPKSVSRQSVLLSVDVQAASVNIETNRCTQQDAAVGSYCVPRFSEALRVRAKAVERDWTRKKHRSACAQGGTLQANFGSPEEDERQGRMPGVKACAFGNGERRVFACIDHGKDRSGITESDRLVQRRSRYLDLQLFSPALQKVGFRCRWTNDDYSLLLCWIT
jgi:hypothetical protein